MSSDSFFVCFEPHKSYWQLGPLDHAPQSLLILGWSSTGEHLDGGISPLAARILTRSLTECARVTFACSTLAVKEAGDEWTRIGNDYVRRLTDDRGARRLISADKLPKRATLVSTRDPATLVRAFDDGGFPWWLQGQVMLLSNPTAQRPPDFRFRAVRQLTDDRWLEEATSIPGLTGVLRPGVDGAMAGIQTLNAGLRALLLDAFESQSQAAGVSFEIVDEATFIECL